MAARLELHRLRRLGRDAVLVPGDVPGDRDHELLVHARERKDARPRLAEALRDSADRPAIVARVVEVGRLDGLELGLAQPPEDRLRGDRLLRRRLERREDRREQPLPPRRWTGPSAWSGFPPCTQPYSAAISWQSGQTSTNSPPVGRISHRTLTLEKAPVADGAGAGDRLPCDLHGADLSPAPTGPRQLCWSSTCVFYRYEAPPSLSGLRRARSGRASTTSARGSSDSPSPPSCSSSASAPSTATSCSSSFPS